MPFDLMNSFSKFGETERALLEIQPSFPCQRERHWKTVLEGPTTAAITEEDLTHPFDNDCRSLDYQSPTSDTDVPTSSISDEYCDIKSYRRYKCIICGKSFKQSSNQKKHYRQVHLKLRPYQCQFNGCLKSYSQKSVAYTHFKTVHLGERPHQCPVCLKMFSDKSNMKKHIRNLHQKEKPHECTECGNKFGEKRSLTDHINCVHLKMKPYVCPVTSCSRRFGQKTHMSKHFRTRHSNSFGISKSY